MLLFIGGPDILYRAFLDTLKTHSSSHEVFDTIREFTQNCSDTLNLLQEKDGRFKVSKKVSCFLFQVKQKGIVGNIFATLFYCS